MIFFLIKKSYFMKTNKRNIFLVAEFRFFHKNTIFYFEKWKQDFNHTVIVREGHNYDCKTVIFNFFFFLMFD